MPVIEILSNAAEVDKAQAKNIFTTLVLFVHGYASMFANNTMKYDEESIAKDLERVFVGAVYASKEDGLNDR